MIEQSDMENITSSLALTLIGARNGSMWKWHSEIEDAFCRTPEMLFFNPLYGIEEAADGLVLKARWPSDVLQQECNRDFTVLPERFEISSQVVKEINDLQAGGLISDNVRDLLRSFILVNLPLCYPRKNLLGAKHNRFTDKTAQTK